MLEIGPPKVEPALPVERELQPGGLYHEVSVDHPERNVQGVLAREESDNNLIQQMD